MENTKNVQNIKFVHVLTLAAFLMFSGGDLLAALFGWFIFVCFAMPREWG